MILVPMTTDEAHLVHQAIRLVNQEHLNHESRALDEVADRISERLTAEMDRQAAHERTAAALAAAFESAAACIRKAAADLGLEPR